MPSQNEYNVAKQNNRIIYAKIYLLNFNLQRVDELSGVVLDGATFSIDANSDVRRTCSLSIVPTSSSFDIKYGSKVWIDKYIQIYVGIKDNITQEVVYTNMGVYLINNPSKVYNATSNTLTINGLDLMSKLTGLRNGYLSGVEYQIPSGSSIREAIIALLQENNITKYVLEEPSPTSTLPNDMITSIGDTYYTILTELRDINSNYQMYFDVDGVFHFDKIPSGKNEAVRVDDDVLQSVLIDYNNTVDYSTIKNVIEVYGKTWEVSNYFPTTTFEDNVYTLSGLVGTTFYDGMIIGFNTTDGSTEPKVYIEELGETLIVYADTKEVQYATLLPPDTASGEESKYQILKYVESGDKAEGSYFVYYGELTPSGYAEDDNPDSPFYVNGTAGKIRIVLSGGEYDNIYTSELAQQRAEYELYLRCQLQDQIQVTLVPLYWLDVNWLVELTLPNEQGGTETNQYITKSISTTLGVSGTQSVSMMKYYPLYNE